MSDRDDLYHTTSWDAGEVKGQPASKQSGGKKKKSKRRRRGMNPLLGIVIWCAFVFSASYLLAGVGWLLANDLCAFDKPEKEVVIEVPAQWFDLTKEIENDNGTVDQIVVCNMEKVTDKLKEEGLIEYDWFFRLFAWFYKGDEKVKQGTYTLNSTMDYMALIRSMRGTASAGSAVTVDVSIPEGYKWNDLVELSGEDLVEKYEA